MPNNQIRSVKAGTSRGKGRRAAAAENPDTERAQIMRALTQIIPDGKPNTDADVRQRIELYFKWCSDTGMPPLLETLSLAIGVSRMTLWRWQCGQGCSPERMQLIEQAKAVCLSYLSTCAIQSKVNPIFSIFNLKCNYGYSEYQIQTAPNETETINIERIAGRLPEHTDNENVIDADFTEITKTH